MASAHHQAHSYTIPPHGQDNVRLPSIKDLNFHRGGPPPGASTQSDYAPISGHPSRHEPSPWQRSSSSASGPPSQQHAPPMPPPPEPSKSQYSSSKVEQQYPPPGMQLPTQPPSGPSGSSGGPPNSRGDVSQSAIRRARSNSSLSETPGRSPHAPYPPHASYPPQPPPSSFHQVQGAPSHPEAVHQPSYGHPPPYHPYPPPNLPQRHYPMAPPNTHQSPPGGSYPPPPEHWQHQAPPPPHPHGPYEGFPRTTPLVPANVEPRGGISPNEADRARQGTISEIVKHCKALHNFAARYAGVPHAQPPPKELEEMSQRASKLVRLLDQLRRLSLPEDQIPKELPVSNGASDEYRPPKRPWEDVSHDDGGGPSAADGHRQEYPDDNKPQTTAEQDMEIIRSKRATSTAGNAPGQPKSKYRKRSRATPPGKCHSCNIRETPEWRRGPDGARTLCNACGLHYAKLMRKRDKAAIGPDGKPTITIESLRASTASARGADPSESQPQAGPSHHQNSPTHHPSGPTSPYEGPPTKQLPLPPMHPSHHPPHPHSGPYQLMPVGSGPPPAGHHQMMPPPTNAQGEGGIVPTPPWITSSSAPSSRGYGGEHQSYMRTSHPPSHARGSPQ